MESTNEIATILGYNDDTPVEKDSYFVNEINRTMEEINGKVGLPDGYFLKMAKADYRDYRAALWREIYQNSIDAGATRIEVSWDRNSRTITIVDDGCGMDLNTLRNRLLVLGGSKKAEGATGAFGKAKELELFSWEVYELHTNNLLLTGSGNEYTIIEVPEYLDGTSISLVIQEDEDFGYLTGFAKIVAQKTETNCAIIVDGTLVECTATKGELIKTLDCGAIYVNGDLPANSYAKVRMNGIWMFDQYAGQDTPHITLELSGSSVASLNSNRDGMKNCCLDEANKFFHRLASDRMSALHPEKVELKLHTEGEDGQLVEMSDEDMEFINQRFRMEDRAGFLKGMADFMAANCEDLDRKLTEMRALGEIEPDTENPYERMKFFGFHWDTIHKFTKGQENQAKNFIDGSAQKAKRAKTLMTMWGETIRQVMLDIKEYRSFTIGFNWDENQQAQLAQENGALCFYLNPSILGKYPLTNKKMLVKKLRLLATHEVSHISRDHHDEYFMMEMESNVEKTWGSEKLYDQIAKIK